MIHKQLNGKIERARRKWESAKETHLSTEEAWYFPLSFGVLFFVSPKSWKCNLFHFSFGTTSERAHELSYMSRNKTLRITCEYPRCCSSWNFQLFQHAHPPFASPLPRQPEKKVLRALHGINCNSNPILLIGLAEPKRNFCVCVCVCGRYVCIDLDLAECAMWRKSYFMCSLYAFFCQFMDSSISYATKESQFGYTANERWYKPSHQPASERSSKRTRKKIIE